MWEERIKSGAGWMLGMFLYASSSSNFIKWAQDQHEVLKPL